MLQYLINSSTIWLMSLVMFYAMLKTENYHSYNRFYLLFTFLLGCLLPAWQLTGSGYNSMITEQVLYLATQGWLKWVSIIYLSGAAIVLLMLVIDIIKLVSYYNTGKKEVKGGWTIIETGKEHPAFSFLDILFVAKKENYNTLEWEMILNHEKQHSILLHIIDMFLMQIARILFWFNPLVYVYNTYLMLVHEYQADKAAAHRPQEYGRFLIEQSVMKSSPALAHSFNSSSIKNRIVMLTKNALPRTGKSNLKLLLVLPLTGFCLLFFTKNSYSENKSKPAQAVCKKIVSRIIDVREKEDTLITHLKDVSPDTTLVEMMVNAVISGKITAYHDYDTRLISKITGSDVKEMLMSKPDTVITKNSLTGKEELKIIKHNFDYSAIHKYRILEEWTYNWATGKTEIETIGVAPIMDIYIADNFRGIKAMFYLHFSDARRIIDHYELYHPNHTICSHIWNDYFNQSESNDSHL